MTYSYDISDMSAWGSSTPVRTYINGVTLSGDLSLASAGTSQIDRRELAELKDDSKLLYALIDAGVENWPGYQEALALYRETE